MEVGPDGLLYFPLMTANQIWRVDPPDGGEPEVVTGDLGVPDSVKFDANGDIVSTGGQRAGAPDRPRSGRHTVLATLTPPVWTTVPSPTEGFSSPPSPV